MIFLNRYFNSSEFTDKQGNIKCATRGPDLIRVNHLSSVKSFYSKHVRLLKQDVQSPQVTTEVPFSNQSLLQCLHNIHPTSSNNRETMKVINNKGATLVLIEGPTSKLSDFKDLMIPDITRRKGRVVHGQKKPYLVPNVKDAKIGMSARMFQQRFHIIEPRNIFENDASICNDLHHVESFDDYVSQGISSMISTTCFDLKHYPHGLIFCFRKVQDETCEMTIKSQYILPSSMQHNEIYEMYGGVVVSEWYQHENFFNVPQEAVNVMHTVYGQKGFGDRHCAKCLGTNIYNGERQTEATVGNPL